MKTVLVVLLVMLASVAFGVDAVPVAPAAPVSVLAWFQANASVVLGLALAISELLALIPGFQGNGVLDTIIKALKVLSNKEQPPA